ncbi:G2 and S phase-expressed protein 1 [Mastacembelus armatus]|uniref:G-2 and S-phase expressed 1 n=1 Tax=Mastacembelus armatus TaxID=205130 RepID=A0A3Q3NKV1_9TELE|nr:G2 and S phase-expressed protein 1-like [Mastacembelus armatus]XP_026168264.1 G2 and S phase-expressed protein 1-like [Mastacembelus armatus]XP_026168265.1 G2 and S phase-expressed protein 1-like [Mastacembelus armatus]XP_026168266.1 G2 and S phase-expressed protein 1-like [Mastacembelus armatus]XP_026168267.1 G2 and S phase-expressed protein 1-like [Mastacembelus armatus]
MSCRANSDVCFLVDEKFDFEDPLSPESSKSDEEEDEVFVGPVSHKERCVSVNVASRIKDGGDGVRLSWSPLSGDQLEAVCQEAQRLATQLQGSDSSQLHCEDDESNDTTTKEEFILDAETKMGVFCQPSIALSPVKRQTFCVQDSPMKQLPPAVQKRLLKRSSTASSTRPMATKAISAIRPTVTSSSARSTARLSTSSPVAVAKVQPRAVLRGKALLGVGVVLPSKPAAPTTASTTSKGGVEKTRLQPPSKAVGNWKRSPASHSSSRAESYEDLLSDSMSVTSDVSDSSFNSSLVGKRTLVPPTKSVVRNLSGVKAPALQSKRVTDRRNTSSSSSSVSSFNSSFSLSPAKGKVNSSLNRSLSSSTGPTHSSANRPANHSRPRRSTVSVAVQPTTSSTSRRSLSAQARKLTEVERAKTARSTPLKRTEATPLHPTPIKRVLERAASIPATASVRPQTGLKAKPKLEALVLPTPSSGVRGVQHGDNVSKMMNPKRLMSASSMDSLLQKPFAGHLTPFAGHLTPPAGNCKLLQVKARRASALPTPVRRLASTIPSPTNQTRPTKLLSTSDPALAPDSTSTSRESSCSPAPADSKEAEPVDTPDIQPFCLEEEMEPPTASPCSAPQPDQSESTDPGALSDEQSEHSSNLIELESTEENSRKPEVLLMDLPAPALQPQEKLLIDLTNTPDLIRTSNKSCAATQLIDLSSPLIKWSPDDKKENAPLINLSF